MSNQQDEIHKLFTRMLMNFKTFHKVEDAAMAGLLIGSAATIARAAGISLHDVLTVTENCWNGQTGANDNPPKVKYDA